MSKEIEIWKDVKAMNGIDCTGLYEACALGMVRNKNTKMLRKIRVKGGRAAGYCYLNLHRDAKRKTVALHRVIAITFIPNPENKPEVNHIDGNKLNNNVNNLEWCTRQENMRHAKLLRKNKFPPSLIKRE